MSAGAPLRFLFPPSLGDPKARARAELLGDALTKRLERDFSVEIAPSYEALEREITGATAGLAWAPPIVCARSLSAVRVVLRAVRGGRSTFRAAMVCRASDPLDARSLRGKRAAWVDPMSTSGYALALAWMRSVGVDPDRTLSAQRFHGSFRAALLAVVEHEADVSSIFVHRDELEGALATLTELLGPLAGSLAPFALTPESPTDAILVTKRVGATVAEQLARALLPSRRGSLLPLLRDVCSADGFALEDVGAEIGAARAKR